jgi:hypothetical protein
MVDYCVLLASAVFSLDDDDDWRCTFTAIKAHECAPDHISWIVVTSFMQLLTFTFHFHDAVTHEHEVELMNYMEQVTEPRDVLVLDQCAVGSSLVINAEKNGKSRWFAADVVGSVPSTGKPLLVLQVGDDLKAMPRYFEGRGGATKEDQNRNLKLTNKVDDLEYQLKMANQERDRCAENARLAMKFLSPPGYDTAGLLRKSSKELALVDMPAFLQKVQDHMKKLNKKSAAGSGGKK